MATASVTDRHTRFALAIAGGPDYIEPVTPLTPDQYDPVAIRALVPGSVKNPIHALAIGYFAYLRRHGLFFNRQQAPFLETHFGLTGEEAVFYLADLQDCYHRLFAS